MLLRIITRSISLKTHSGLPVLSCCQHSAIFKSHNNLGLVPHTRRLHSQYTDKWERPHEGRKSWRPSIAGTASAVIISGVTAGLLWKNIKSAECSTGDGRSDNFMNWATRDKFETGKPNFRIIYKWDSAPLKLPPGPEDRGDRRSVEKSGLSRTKLSELPVPPPAPTRKQTESTKKKQETPVGEDTEVEAPLPVYVQEQPRGQPHMSVPNKVTYLVVGGGTAGMAAARAIRASDSTAQVLMINSEGQLNPKGLSNVPNAGSYPPYMRPPLSKELWRRSQKRQNQMLDANGDMRKHSWMFYEPDNFFLPSDRLNLATYGGISLVNGRSVVKLDPENRQVELDNGHKIHYGQLLLATGGRPRRLPGVDTCAETGQDLVKAGRVSYFRGVDHFKNVRELTEKYVAEGGRIAIIGGGFLGSELAISLGTLAKKSDKMEVIQVYRESGNMAHILPEYLSDHTRDYLSSHGVKIRGQMEVADSRLVQGGKKVQLTIQGVGGNGEKVVEIVDHVIVAVGIEANTDLASSSGLETDPHLGGYLVNAELEARAGVYVAGDASSYFDPLLGRRRVEHINHAEESGKLAGRNMAAAMLSTDSGVLLPRATYGHQSSFWCSLGKDLSCDAVGHIDAKELDTHGFFAFPLDDEGNHVTENPNYDTPGVVFYTKGGRIVGVLLWNLPDDLYHDEKHFAPSRLSLVRKILDERRTVTTEELMELARDFDIYETVDEDYQELKSFMAAKEKEGQASKGEE